MAGWGWLNLSKAETLETVKKMLEAKGYTWSSWVESTRVEENRVCWEGRDQEYEPIRGEFSKKEFLDFCNDPAAWTRAALSVRDAVEEKSAQEARTKFLQDKTDELHRIEKEIERLRACTSAAEIREVIEEIETARRSRR